MASRTRPPIPVTWFLREWMDALKVRQIEMMRLTGWSKTTASHLYNCQQDMNVELLKTAASALNVHLYELLMHPDEAMKLRRLRDTALSIAADNSVPYRAEPPELQTGT